MPTETQHLEQRVAALQSDLNTKDEQIDALTFSDNDRELSRRSWLDEAKRLEKEVEALRKALKFYADREHYHFESGNWDTVSGEPLNILWCGDEPDFIEDGTVARNALSACAEPSAPVDPVDAALDRISVKLDRAIELCEASIEKAPTERDERAAFEQAFVVQDGVFFSAERNEYRSMNGRSIEYTDATDLNLRLQGWQARAALDKSTEGASHE